MSTTKATKRKHVFREIVDFDPESLSSHQQIVRILGSRGRDLHEVEGEPSPLSLGPAYDSNKSNSELVQFLVSMPTKFRGNVFVKRGDFVVVEEIEEGDRVRGEIKYILLKDHIKQLRKSKLWPKLLESESSLGQSQDMPLPPSSDEEEQSTNELAKDSDSCSSDSSD